MNGEAASARDATSPHDLPPASGGVGSHDIDERHPFQRLSKAAVVGRSIDPLLAQEVVEE